MLVSNAAQREKNLQAGLSALLTDADCRARAALRRLRAALGEGLGLAERSTRAWSASIGEDMTESTDTRPLSRSSADSSSAVRLGLAGLAASLPPEAQKSSRESTRSTSVPTASMSSGVRCGHSTAVSYSQSSGGPGATAAGEVRGAGGAPGARRPAGSRSACASRWPRSGASSSA